MLIRLEELKTSLLNCDYPEKIIDKGFHNAKLQGPAPQKNQIHTVPLITQYGSNYETKTLCKNIKTFISQLKCPKLKNIFDNVQVISAYKQPSNIGKLLIRAKFDKPHLERNISTTTALPSGLYAICKDSRCNLCKFKYIQTCSKFRCSNGKDWVIKSVITCNSTNVLYYLVCNMCNTASYVGKTWQKLRGRTNDHISKCRNGNGKNKFDDHVYNCGIKNNCLKPPYFKVYAFMSLKSKTKLLTYEKYLQKNGYDNMN